MNFRTKTCRECGETKTLRNFYKHPTCADGYRNICKPCHCKQVNENHELKSDQRSVWRKRHRAKPEVRAAAAAWLRAYRRTPRGKRLTDEAKRTWIMLHPEQHARVQREAQARYALKKKQQAAA